MPIYINIKCTNTYIAPPRPECCVEMDNNCASYLGCVGVKPWPK